MKIKLIFMLIALILELTGYVLLYDYTKSWQLTAGVFLAIWGYGFGRRLGEKQ